MKISQFKTDLQKESKGVWVDIGEGLMLKIARMNNPQYRRMVQKMGRSQARLISSGTNIDLMDEMNRKLAAHTILLDWKNLQDDDGNDVPYSTEKALEYLTSYPDFFNIVMGHAADIELYREEGFGEKEGNLENTSSGN